MKGIIITLTFIFIITGELQAASEKLSGIPLFVRCYMHLTQTFPSKNNPYRLKVESGQMEPIAACLAILNKTSLSGNSVGVQVDSSDQEQVELLNTFHRLHYSWFSNRYYPEILDYYIRNVGNVFDASNPALYLTRALLDPTFNFDQIFTGDLTLRGVRKAYAQTNSIVDLPSRSSSNDALQGIKYPGGRELLGVEELSKDISHNVMAEKSGSDPTLVAKAPIVINTHWGGGVLGSQVYMLQNIQGSSIHYLTDGGVKSNRKWSRSVIQDFLCRELPILRDQDVGQFVLGNSSLTYRNSKGCVKCHSTMDPMAAVTRKVQYTRVSAFYNDGGSYAFLTKPTAVAGDASYFPSAPDKSFYARPAKGHLMLRTYDGKLVYKEVTGLEQLAQEMIKLNDPYVCMAKRYFEYFTGISVNLSDIKDPANKDFPSLSKSDQFYRDAVIDLGLNLKINKNPKKLIENILKHDVYKLEDYGISKNK